MTQSTVNLSAAQALTDAQGAAAYRLLTRVAATSPNQPLAVGVADAATAVVSMRLATTAQLAAAPAPAPASAAPDPLVAAVAHVAAQQQIRVLAENEHQLAAAQASREAAAQKAQTQAACRALGLTVRDEDHR